MCDEKTKIAPTERPKWFAAVLLLSSSALWGASFIFTKDLFLNTPHVTTQVIITGRLLVATLCFMPYLAATHRLPRLQGKDVGLFMVMALLEPFLYHLCETSGIALVSGSLSSIIIALIPLFIPFSMVLRFHEKLQGNQILGVMVSILGICMMIVGPGFTLLASPKGLMLLFSAVIVALIYNMLLYHVIGRYSPFAITAYTNVFALFYFIPLLLVSDHAVLPLIHISPRFIFDIVFLGIFCSTFAYVFYNYGYRAIGATRAASYNNLIPVFSLLLALAIGQERLTPMKAAGMAVVVGGLFLAQRESRAKKKVSRLAEH
ncbi:MAG: DMT family transporter [Bacteroidales bacterium]|nr:DMT family transporter [Bacteroidales bacterium]